MYFGTISVQFRDGINNSYARRKKIFFHILLLHYIWIVVVTCSFDYQRILLPCTQAKECNLANDIMYNIIDINVGSHLIWGSGYRLFIIFYFSFFRPIRGNYKVSNMIDTKSIRIAITMTYWCLLIFDCLNICKSMVDMSCLNVSQCLFH